MEVMGALDIYGWMSERELNWLSRMASRCNLVIEIGTWLGRSTHTMGEVVMGKVITIDHFSPELIPGSSQSSFYKSCIPNEHRDDPEWLYKLCLTNLRELIEKGKVEVLRGESSSVVEKLDDLKGRADMVFIDGDHSYDAVKKDITNYKPILRAGGLLCGHDFRMRQVRQAVIDILPGAKRARGTSIWAYRY